MKSESRRGCLAAPKGQRAAARAPGTDSLAPSGAVAGLILASGLSSRFGAANKLLLTIDGVPLVRRVAAAFVEAGLDPVLVVTGHDSEAVQAALGGLHVQFVSNPDFREGQSRALVRGVGALPAYAQAVVIGVGDQPHLSPDVIRRLVLTFRHSSVLVVAPRYAGQRGNPVLFAAPLFPELLRVQGDQGGRGVLAAHASELAWVDIPDPRLGIDVDTPDALST